MVLTPAMASFCNKPKMISSLHTILHSVYAVSYVRNNHEVRLKKSKNGDS
jgi:hypothetical protein